MTEIEIRRKLKHSPLPICSKTSCRLLWKLDIPDKPIIVHFLEEIEPLLVNEVLAVVMEDVEMDESWEEAGEDQRVEEPIA